MSFPPPGCQHIGNESGTRCTGSEDAVEVCMRINHDLAPAASQVARIADGVDDDQLCAETPCADWPVAVLLGHLIGLSTAFTAAARKERAPDGGPEPDGRLPGDWRSRLRERLDALVAAWRDPEAWQGRTEIAGLITPAGTVGVIALDELVLHGWDLARATGQPFHAEPAGVRASLGFAASMAEPGQEAAREGLYGPAVPVSEGASELERLLGLAGRDPQWTSGGSALTASSTAVRLRCRGRGLGDLPMGDRAPAGSRPRDRAVHRTCGHC